MQQVQALSGVSPTKRRSSPALANDSQATAAAKPPSPSTKRPKPDAPPPKVLPESYQFCPVEDMVELIAHMLAELIATNDAIRISNGGLTRFHSRYFAALLQPYNGANQLTWIAGLHLEFLFEIIYTAWPDMRP